MRADDDVRFHGDFFRQKMAKEIQKLIGRATAISAGVWYFIQRSCLFGFKWAAQRAAFSFLSPSISLCRLATASITAVSAFVMAPEQPELLLCTLVLLFADEQGGGLARRKIHYQLQSKGEKSKKVAEALNIGINTAAITRIE